MQDTPRIPPFALWLGVAGLIPFYGLLAAVALDWAPHPLAALNAFAIYGAVILSFVGAIWWGLAVHTPDGPLRNAMFTLSVFAALIGTGALLLPTIKGLALLMAGFLAQNLADFWLKSHDPALFPRWLWHLRRGLTMAVALAIALASALAP